MSRVRGTETSKLPPYVYARKARNCYIFKQYIGKGKTAKTIRLCSMDEPISKVWEYYESIGQEQTNTLRWLLDTFNNAPITKNKSVSSQKQCMWYRNALCEMEGKHGAKFGDILLIDINRRLIRRYLDSAEKKVGANRHIQYLKAAWNWGSERYAQVPEQNPCAKVKLNPEESRTRYVEDWEFALVQEIIDNTTRSPYLSVMMEFAFLCRLRCSEVRSLKVADLKIKDGFIRCFRGKGSRGELTRITTRLRLAINRARSLNPDAPTPIGGAYLLHDKKGLMINKNTFDCAWQRVMEKAKTKGIDVDGKRLKLTEHFTFHDLKAKGVSDHTEHHSGHKSEKVRQIYIRRLQEVDATK